MKFRAWDENTKRFIYWGDKESWIPCVSFDGRFVRASDYGFSYDDELIIEQWAGLVDKHKTKIYENDRVLVEGLPYIFDNIFKADSLREYCDKGMVEVVGNIHEDQEENDDIT